MQTSEFDSFGQRLEYAIHERELSLYRVAKLAGISDPMVRKYIRGETSPSLEKVEDLAKAINVSFLWLAKGRGPMDNIIDDDVAILDDVVLKMLSVNLFKLKNILNIVMYKQSSKESESDEDTIQKILKECIRITLN